MKKYIWMILFVSNLVAFYYDRIIVIDISGSMKRGGLAERVKASCKEYLKKIKIGERVIIMTFGTDVNPGLEDREIKGLKDIEELQGKIDQLSFNDKYTWMTKAFDVIAKRLEELQKAFPDRPKYVVIFTDGINEPPPGYEGEFTFEEILETHFKTFTKENTFIYVVTLGVKPQRELIEMEEKEMIKIIEKTPEAPPLQTIELSPEKFIFEDEVKEEIKGTFKLNVEKLEGIKEIPLFFEVSNESLNVKVFPDTFTIMKENQTLEFNYSVAPIKNEGIFNFSLIPKTNIKGVLIHPSKINFEIKLKKVIRAVEMELKNFVFKSLLKDTIKVESEIYIKNLHNLKEVPITLKKELPSGELNIEVEPLNFLIKNKGEKINLKLKLIGIKQPGNYMFFLLPSTDVKNVTVLPDKFKFEIYIKKPFIIPFWFWILLCFFLFLVLAGFFSISKCKRMKWPENYCVVLKRNGDEISVWEIILYQKFCKNVITSDDLKIDDVYFKLKYEKNKVFKYNYEQGKWEEIKNGERIVSDYYFEIKEV